MLHRGGDQWELISENWATQRTIIHSGNIGSYKAGDADKLDGLDGVQYAKSIRNALHNADGNVDGLAGGKLLQGEGTFPISTAKNGPFLAFGHSGYQCQISSRSNRTWLRTQEANEFSEWREIAYLDSNVAWSQGLKHSNGTVGAVVNSSGNVTIGAEDMAHGLWKFYCNGPAAIWDKSRRTLDQNYIKNSALLQISSYPARDDDSLYIGQLENATAWIQAAFGGSESNPSKNHTFPIALNPLGGNVLIGTTTNSGYKLDVAGTGRFTGAVTMASTLNVGGNVFFKTAGKLDAYGNFHFTSPTTGSWAIVRGNGNDALLIDNATGDTTIYGNLVVAGDISA